VETDFAWDIPDLIASIPALGDMTNIREKWKCAGIEGIENRGSVNVADLAPGLYNAPQEV